MVVLIEVGDVVRAHPHCGLVLVDMAASDVSGRTRDFIYDLLCNGDRFVDLIHCRGWDGAAETKAVQPLFPN